MNSNVPTNTTLPPIDNLLHGSPAIALSISALAGLATCIGGLAPFCKCVNLGNKRILAMSLGFAAGVMIYISLIDIFEEAINFFVLDIARPYAYLFTTVGFFGGCTLAWIINLVVHFMEDGCRCHSELPCFEKKKEKIDKIEMVQAETTVTNNPITGNYTSTEYPATHITLDEDPPNVTQKSKAELIEEGKKLLKLGWLAAIALALHNFPEGLATFVASIQDPKLGGALAVAIAIHNIPEGLCIAMPIFYASGSKWKALAFVTVAGLAEPLGALIGWGFLSVSFSPNAYGAIFSVVGGMMFYIGIAELIPAAHQHDTKDTVVSKSVIAGCVILSASLVAFQF